MPRRETEPESNPDAIGGRADLIYNRIGSERDETDNADTMPSGKGLPDRLCQKRRLDNIRRGGIGQETVPRTSSGFGGVGGSGSGGGRSRRRSAGTPGGAD